MAFPTAQDFTNVDRDMETIDAIANSRDPVTGALITQYPTRKGDTAYTGRGLELNAAPDSSDGFTFAAGFTLTRWNQVARTADGNFWGYRGSVLPLTVAVGFNPVGSANWYVRSDVVLRGDLAATTGAGLVGTTDGITVQSKLNALDTTVAAKANTSDLALKADASALALKADTTIVNSRTKKGGLTTAVAGGAMTLTQSKRLFSFRSATLTDGTAVEVTPAADMTLTVPNGASLGAVSGLPAEYLEILLYNGGSPVVGIVNAACGLNLDESGLISSSAISASATSAMTVYSSIAVTNSPYIVLNSLRVTLPTAGVWSVQPNIQVIDLTGSAMFSRKMLLPAIATTSGTSVGFTGIPSWAKKLTLMFNGVSTSATSPLLIKLGINGVAQSSTYTSAAFLYANTFASSTTGFYFGYRVTAAAVADGVLTLTKGTDLSWFGVGVWANGNAGSAGGSCVLTGSADSVFITTVAGTDVFDAGSISLLIEG